MIIARLWAACNCQKAGFISILGMILPFCDTLRQRRGQAPSLRARRCVRAAGGYGIRPYDILCGAVCILRREQAPALRNGCGGGLRAIRESPLRMRCNFVVGASCPRPRWVSDLGCGAPRCGQKSLPRGGRLCACQIETQTAKRWLYSANLRSNSGSPAL